MRIPVPALLSATATLPNPPTNIILPTDLMPILTSFAGVTTKTRVVSGVTHTNDLVRGPCRSPEGVYICDEQGPVAANTNALNPIASLVTRGGDLDGPAASTGGIKMHYVEWPTLSARPTAKPVATEARVHPVPTGTEEIHKRDTKGPFPEIDWLGFAVEGDAKPPASATPVEPPVGYGPGGEEGVAEPLAKT